MAEASTIYDKVPYPSYTFPQTHPDRLATAAYLHGLNPASPANCRVLELGCGDGTNLIAQAYALPESTFVGIDLSTVQIERAIDAAEKIGIKNIRFRAADITSIAADELGRFDFITAHGLYSWVPDHVRRTVLDLYANCLAENGIGYISYNTYPGCHIRQMVAGMMKFAARDAAEPFDAVEDALAALEFVERASENDSLYQMTIRLELQQTEERSAENVFHDDLAEINQPFYFYEFAADIVRHGLRYITDADPRINDLTMLPQDVRSELDAASSDRIEREQYIDFIKGRRFRKSLVTHAVSKVLDESDAERINSLFIASQLRPDDPSSALDDQTPLKFHAPQGGIVELDHPLTKSLLAGLAGEWARPRLVEKELRRAAERIHSQETGTADALSFILRLYESGTVTLCSYANQIAVTEVSSAPRLSAFARHQIENDSRAVMTLYNLNIDPEPETIKVLLSLLDGKRTENELCTAIKEIFEVPEDEKDAFERELPQMIRANLEKFAALGLLVG
ncbi:MAG: methyltransferase regulatory domain-containing protein [Chloracidobacterium sp.]|nr:methyltransferase regulatory domain-containing protein [Chloracidobacterium sp.]MCO5334086.1 class I SAM-dependent methyltransferase [Pyrinomonadaceae bacterium]